MLSTRPDRNTLGPLIRPHSIAMGMPGSRPPASRTVVKPRRSMASRMNLVSMAIQDACRRTIAARSTVVIAACTCASIRPGIKVLPSVPMTATSAPATIVRPFSATSTITSSSIRIDAPGRSSAASTSRSLAFSMMRPGIGCSCGSRTLRGRRRRIEQPYHRCRDITRSAHRSRGLAPFLLSREAVFGFWDRFVSSGLRPPVCGMNCWQHSGRTALSGERRYCAPRQMDGMSRTPVHQQKRNHHVPQNHLRSRRSRGSRRHRACSDFSFGQGRTRWRLPRRLPWRCAPWRLEPSGVRLPRLGPSGLRLRRWRRWAGVVLLPSASLPVTAPTRPALCGPAGGFVGVIAARVADVARCTYNKQLPDAWTFCRRALSDRPRGLVPITRP
jgi:hypothetical protein